MWGLVISDALNIFTFITTENKSKICTSMYLLLGTYFSATPYMSDMMTVSNNVGGFLPEVELINSKDTSGYNSYNNTCVKNRMKRTYCISINHCSSKKKTSCY